jgi:hypothetical protein
MVVGAARDHRHFVGTHPTIGESHFPFDQLKTASAVSNADRDGKNKSCPFGW